MVYAKTSSNITMVEHWSCQPNVKDLSPTIVAGTGVAKNQFEIGHRKGNLRHNWR